MKPHTPTVESYRILQDSGETGHEPLFAALRRVELSPIFSSGEIGPAYSQQLVMRTGIDAVAVIPYVPHADPLQTRVVLRVGQRAAVWLRRMMDLPIAEPEAPARLREVVAGVREWGEYGEAGLKRRAAEELHEEIGLRVSCEELHALGCGFFPSPGIYPEKIYPYRLLLSAAQCEQISAVGDGSSSEAGAATETPTLKEALTLCAGNALQDLKTEICLRRLLAYLRQEL